MKRIHWIALGLVWVGGLGVAGKHPHDEFEGQPALKKAKLEEGSPDQVVPSNMTFEGFLEEGGGNVMLKHVFPLLSLLDIQHFFATGTIVAKIFSAFDLPTRKQKILEKCEDFFEISQNLTPYKREWLPVVAKAVASQRPLNAVDTVELQNLQLDLSLHGLQQTIDALPKHTLKVMNSQSFFWSLQNIKKCLDIPNLLCFATGGTGNIGRTPRFSREKLQPGTLRRVDLGPHEFNLDLLNLITQKNAKTLEIFSVRENNRALDFVLILYLDRLKVLKTLELPSMTLEIPYEFINQENISDLCQREERLLNAFVSFLKRHPTLTRLSLSEMVFTALTRNDGFKSFLQENALRATPLVFDVPEIKPFKRPSKRKFQKSRRNG